MIDHRDNPKLHALYVSRAMEILEVADKAIENLYEFSHVDASILAGALQKERADIISDNTAWQEAVWRRSIGQSPEDIYSREEESTCEVDEAEPTYEVSGEKLSLSKLIEMSKERMASMTDEERAAMIQAQRESWARQDKD